MRRAAEPQTRLLLVLKPLAALLRIGHVFGAKSTRRAGPASARTSPTQLSSRDEWHTQAVFALPSTSHCYERWSRFSIDAPSHSNALLHLPCVIAIR